MKKIYFLIAITLSLFSCSKPQKNMLVNGNIIGFKKGTIYLDKLIDSTFVSVDSVTIDGTNQFEISDNNDEVLLYQIRFGEQIIPFFGEKGNIAITSKLEKLETSYTVSGSKSNDLYNNYKDMQRQFNNKKLELIKTRFEAEQLSDTNQVQELSDEIERLEKKRLLYIANFAKTNNNSNVSPFVVLLDLSDGHPTLLSKIYNDFTPEVQNSTYGQLLKNYMNN